jgi:hypothetical protein
MKKTDTVSPVVEAAAPMVVTVTDALGNIRSDDYTEAELSSLDDTGKNLLIDLIAARLAETDADATLADAYKNVSKLSDVLDAKHEAVTLIRPETSDDRRVEEVRRTIRANTANAQPIKETKEARELAARIEKAEHAAAVAVDDLLAARQSVVVAKDGQRRARIAIAAALAAWVANCKPVTFESLAREQGARTQERLLAVANGSFVPPPAPAPPSALDGFMRGGARGKSSRRAG